MHERRKERRRSGGKELALKNDVVHTCMLCGGLWVRNSETIIVCKLLFNPQNYLNKTEIK